MHPELHIDSFCISVHIDTSKLMLSDYVAIEVVMESWKCCLIPVHGFATLIV